MNIVIAGDGEVGAFLAKMLTGKDHNITIIDSSRKQTDNVESHSDLKALDGDPTSIDVLKDADVKNADLLISVLHDEKSNIVTCMLGKKMGAAKTIARVNNLEYFLANSVEIFNSAGIDELVFPELIAADECIDLISHVSAAEIVEFTDKKLFLQLFHLDEDSNLINKSVKTIKEEFKSGDFTFLIINRDNKSMSPLDTDVLQVGDFVLTLSKPKGKELLNNATGKEDVSIKNIMIVGGGRICRMMIHKLDKDYNVKIIERNAERCNKLAAIVNNNTLVINGDARDIELLEDEDINEMDAFIAVTDNSETNILTCMLAKQFGVKKVIALMDSIDYIELAQRIGVDGIINKKLITASYITRFTLDADVSTIKFLSGIDAEVLEIRAKKGSYVTKRPVGSLHLPDGTVIGGVIRGYESHIVTDDFQIEADDRVVVLCFPDTVQDTIKLFNRFKLFSN
ncbi:Trk system potassium transporter TrkA [Bacteroidales bacterium OttesenSCG-928-K03]|nr:Trk system potassium transporter TrkA [Bacteroidales bacterium OttesenSCG-928-L14]MDL2240261.1 Trk system potassium transporter TrkA [Bacteroidales bacterium OttesenSCG-928-K22]MDL2242783.1 Trk system potassium transporter TrkA [Bacteroidales bacterium OttesenSCG-928-K03]